MYAGGGLLLPYLQGTGFFSFSHDIHDLLQLQEEELLHRFSQNHLLDDNSNCQSQLAIMAGTPANLVQTPTISDYDLGGEGDLFKAPEPILEEPEITLDPVTTVISMMSAGEDVTATEAIKVADIESIGSQQLLSEVFYECKKDLSLLEKTAIEEPPSDLSDIKIQPLLTVEDQIIQRDETIYDGQVEKDTISVPWMVTDQITGSQPNERSDCPLRLNFLDFQEIDFGAALGMRRAYSEGDIEIVGSDNSSVITCNGSFPMPPFQRVSSMDKHKSEERQEKLSRYRKKKSTRNFGRKIKYACRKALADCQPRIRGRFAKTEELELLKQSI